MSRAVRWNKLKHSFQETPVERRATMEVEEANPPWDTREKEFNMKMKSYLQQNERIWVGIGELEQNLLDGF